MTMAGPRAGAAAPVLEVRELGKRYENGHVALEGVSLIARAGELTVILGANGSGKTTLVRCIVRLIEPTTGRIVVAGTDWTGLRGRALRVARRHVAVIFQGSSLIPRRSALANVAAGCLARHQTPLTMVGRFPRAELRNAREALARTGVLAVASQRSETLSGGQSQRVAIARALLQDPALVIADEPVASLDPDATEEVMVLLRGLARERGLAVVCVLHQLEVARSFADRIVGMRAGHVVLDEPASAIEEGALAELYRDVA
jgi:phosphonate transport system ATP-binding protein